MNNENNISEELKNMGSPLAGLTRISPFTVPDGYFDQFPGLISAEIREMENAEPIPSFGKTIPYTVPPGYFENLAENIVAIAAAHDALSGMPKDVPFETPAGYFEALPARLLQSAKNEDAATAGSKVISLKGPNVFRSVQWAAAAIFILFMGIGSYITFFSSRIIYPDAILASVSNTEINDYVLGTYRIDADKIESSNEINSMQLESTEIIEYLDETGWDVVE